MFGEEGVTYCVKPNSSAECIGDDCQRCETFQYYCDNVYATINQKKNVTMVFMSGIHTLYLREKAAIMFKSRTLHLIGRGQNVTITVVCLDGTTTSLCFVEFASNSVNIESLYITGSGSLTLLDIVAPQAMIKNCKFHGSSVELDAMNVMELRVEDCAFLNTDTLIDYSMKLMLKNCTFQEMDVHIAHGTAILEDCHLQNSFMNIASSEMVICGVSDLDACTANVISSISSNITLSGKVSFSNNYALFGGAIFLFNSSLNFAADANVTFSNNVAQDRGGALYLSSASNIFLEPSANVAFINNSANNKGGAVYIEIGMTAARVLFTWNIQTTCFYHLLNCNDNAATNNTINISFVNNSAVYGGDDIYGASLHECSTGSHPCSVIINRANQSTSSISSDPLHVCICDSRGKPQCTDSTFIHMTQELHPGEMFTVHAVLVGWDYGTTTGLVYAQIRGSDGSLLSAPVIEHNKDIQLIKNSKQCTILSYSLNSNHTQENVIIYLSAVQLSDKTVQLYLPGGYCYPSDRNTRFSPCSYTSPIFLNITLLPCPSGFSLLNQHCECYLHHVLFDNCCIVNGTGYFSWTVNAWASIYNGGLLYNTRCPFDYCNITGRQIDLQNDSDSQCAFNRAGRLCGGCKENYSLAIGSSHCIHCPNNNNQALLIFFIAAGILLVLFISALNLTVTQGTINGLIFYANIVWTYQGVFFPQSQEGNSALLFFKVFIAWINLDFGIETCFLSGLTAFWKTWLQFIFPFYIWAIAGLIIIAAKYSSKLTKILGNRGVPLLATLFLLSYMKLLRVTVSSLEFSYLYQLTDRDNTTSFLVWSVDGNLTYFGTPHIFLFLAGLASLLFLCIPYTLLLFLMQWLRRLPHIHPLKLILQFHPVYDAYFAPLKHKHQYWFGVLLLARVILLIMFISTFAIPQYVNLLVLLAISVMLLFWVSIAQPYKSTAILALLSSLLANLVLVSGFGVVSALKSDTSTFQAAVVGISTGLAFLQFCGIVLYTIITPLCGKLRKQADDDNRYEDSFIDSLRRDSEGDMEESKPLLRVTDQPTY